MKRKILLGVVLGTILLFMTGCCMRHEWVEADCVAPQTCNKCGKTEGDALGHKWEEATCISAKTCTVCGKTEGNFADHKWKEATCINVKTCTVCSKTEGEMLEHKWQAATCETPKTCEMCGKTDGDVAAHRWSMATCQKPKTCEKCGKTDGEVTEHNWKTATCVAPETCKMCGMTTGSVSDEHRLDTKGKCKDCNKQIGIELDCFNWTKYLDMDVHVTGRDDMGCIYGYQITVRSKSTNTKFYDVKFHRSGNLDNDGCGGKTIKINSSWLEWVKLDENGYANVITDFESERSRGWKFNVFDVSSFVDFESGYVLVE